MTGKALQNTAKILSADQKIQEKKRKQTLLLLGSESNPDRVFYEGQYPIVILKNEGHQGIYKIFYDKEGQIENYHLLIGASFEFVRIVRPHESSKIGIASAILEFTNQKGESQIIEVTRQSLKDESFKDRLIGFASFHPKANLDRELWSFINDHAIAVEPLRQDAVDHYGWHKDKNDRIVFALENGTETSDGFEDENTSRILLQSGRGLYQGSKIDKASDEVMKLLLCDLNPQADIILFGLFGSLIHLMIPESTGKAPFNFEICGETRSGKSRLVNFLLSLFTAYVPIGANKLRPSSLSIPDSKKDSPIGRNLILASARHIPILDADYKEKVNDPRFDRAYTVRCDLVNVYGDASLAGVISTRDGRQKNRQEYQGLIIRTLEEDYALHSIGKGNYSTEERSYSFQWPIDDQGKSIKSKKDVSIELEKRLIEIYAIGAMFRRWMMNLLTEQRIDLYEKCGLKAQDTVEKFWSVPIGDLQQSHTVYVITGILIWLEFLKTNLRIKGRGKKDNPSFMVKWFEFRIESFIKDRVERSLWIQGQIQESKQKSLNEFVNDTIRFLTLHGDHYIASHQGNSLEVTKGKERDLPTIPKQLGYSLNGKGYTPNKHLLGYFSEDRNFIHFESKDFYRILVKQAELERYQLPSSRMIWSKLCDEGLTVKPNSEKKFVHTVRLPNKIYFDGVRIPVSRIWPSENTDEQSSDLPVGLINQSNGD